jgi:carbamoyltransferase
MSNTILGVSSFFHDAAVSVVRDGKVVFASSSERFSKIKNDKYLHKNLIDFINREFKIDKVIYYENPLRKNLRQVYSLQLNNIVFSPKLELKKLFNCDVSYASHHHSHAALAFYTSDFNSAAVIVIDAIGEFETVSIWKGVNNSLKKLKSYYYPISIGLLYSAFTKLLGFTPNKDEYIVMGLAGYGEPIYFEKIMNDFVYSFKNVHKGISSNYLKNAKKEDIAASINEVARYLVLDIARFAKQITNETNLCYGGGVALNCSINTSLYDIFENIFINPNPGDAGSSLGAILALQNKKINFSPYLGTDIKCKLNPREIALYLSKNNIAGIAHGRAEFSPRALGNRSILACPFKKNIKTQVNYIKGREQFRPLAPVILEEHAEDFFECENRKFPYMQFAIKAKDKKTIPAAVHVDGTSRVQTVSYKQNSNLYNILYEYKKITGIPVLINTSLNLRDQPLLNDEIDKLKFLSKYNLKVF